MSSNSRGLRFWINAWLPVAIGLGIISLESTPYLGTNRTSGPLRWLFQSLFGPVPDVRWDYLHHLIRKTGHFFGYGLLGLAWLRALWMTFPRSRFPYVALLALIATGLVASGDEIHQTFLPNRTGSAWDVLLDCCGALVLQWIVFVGIRFFRPEILVERY